MPNIEDKVTSNGKEKESKMQHITSEILWSNLGSYSVSDGSTKHIVKEYGSGARPFAYNCDSGFEVPEGYNNAFVNAGGQVLNNEAIGMLTNAQGFDSGYRNMAEHAVSTELDRDQSFRTLTQIDQQNHQFPSTDSCVGGSEHQQPETNTYSLPNGSAPGNGYQRQSHPPLPGTHRSLPPLQMSHTQYDDHAEGRPFPLGSPFRGSRIPMRQLSRTPDVLIVPIERAGQNRQVSQIRQNHPGFSAPLQGPFLTEDFILDDEAFEKYGDIETSEPAPTAQLNSIESETTSEAPASNIRQINSSITTSEAAKMHWSRTRWRPPLEDDLPATDADKLDYVLRVESAMLSVNTAEDNPTSTHVKRWIEPAYPHDDIRAAAWHVVDATIALHIHGSIYPIYSFEKTDKHWFAQKDLRFNERMRQICQCLATRKTQCTFVMSNDILKIQNMIAAPTKTAWRCLNNTLANNRKAMRLAHTASLDGRLKASRKGMTESLASQQRKASTLHGPNPKRHKGPRRGDAADLLENGGHLSNGQPEDMELCLQLPDFNKSFQFSGHALGNDRIISTDQSDVFRGSSFGPYGSTLGSSMHAQGLSPEHFDFNFADPQFVAGLDMMIAANNASTTFYPQNYPHSS
ncbi:hypothetical protein AOQ84DRAFT_381047 [Glonium stellatum]|uniref:Uncharacterized protein n=1 Tax=Glonium stellatum TaxID=574774 RepID=A0A8E2JNT6_9PEZI|nr:hypothetical protein AOQ84DRAFT_381047 [Glonium stellatum]